MAKDRLKSRIAEALAEPSPRDSLQRLLNHDGSVAPQFGPDDEATSLQAILENVKDPILALDAGGAVLSANAAANRVFAATAAELADRNIEELIVDFGASGQTL